MSNPPFNNQKEHLLAIRNAKEVLDNLIDQHIEYGSEEPKPKRLYVKIGKYWCKKHHLIDAFRQLNGSYRDGMENKI